MTWEQRAKAGVDAKHFQAAFSKSAGNLRFVFHHKDAQALSSFGGNTMRIPIVDLKLIGSINTSAFTRTYAVVPLQTLDQRSGGPLNCG